MPSDHAIGAFGGIEIWRKQKLGYRVRWGHAPYRWRRPAPRTDAPDGAAKTHLSRYSMRSSAQHEAEASLMEEAKPPQGASPGRESAGRSPAVSRRIALSWSPVSAASSVTVAFAVASVSGANESRIEGSQLPPRIWKRRRRRRRSPPPPNSAADSWTKPVLAWKPAGCGGSQRFLPQPSPKSIY